MVTNAIILATTGIACAPSASRKWHGAHRRVWGARREPYMPIITDTLLKAKKPPAAGRIESKEDRCAGLEFRLTKAGAASWSLRFRDPQTGKPSRFTIG